jgi:hypothetical protein
MKRILAGLLILALLLGGGGFFAAPLVAFTALRSAAEAEDVQGLSKLVDFDAVRASLAPQLDSRPGVQAPPPSVLKDPLGALKAAIEPMAQAAKAPAGPKPDDYLAPRALARLTYGLGRDAWKPSTRETPKPKNPGIDHYGVNRTRLTVADPLRPETVTVFTFERRGPYEWKLVHIGLPSDETPESAPASR